MTSTAGQGLVGPSDIADIADVSRSAVSNWRKRADDFPDPVAGTSAKPLFSREEVTAWLVKRGHVPRSDRGETGVWAAMNALRAELPADDAAEFILSLACARKLSALTEVGGYTGMRWADLTALREDNLEHRLLALFRELDPADGLLSSEIVTKRHVPPVALMRVIEVLGMVDVSYLDTATDFVLERLARAQGKVGADYGFVGSRTSALLARLAAARQGTVLYDPACGIAAALLAAVDDGARPSRVVGHDVSGRVLRMARQRALLHGVDAEFVKTDVFREDIDPELRADVIIAEPPFGLRLDAPVRLTDGRFWFGPPPRMSGDTAWLQHVIAHLAEAGRGYVLTAAGPLFRGGEERVIRSELIRNGCVEAVVGLPGKMLPHTAIPLALWVLRRPTPVDTASRVLLIDAAEEEAPESHIATWLQSADEHQEIPHVNVPVMDILAADSVLSPQRWIARTEHEPRDAARAYTEGRAAIGATMKDLQNVFASLQEPVETASSRVLTVGELIEHGVLDMRSGRSADRYEGLPAQVRGRIVTAADVRDGNLYGTAPNDGIDGLPELTRAGDVLVTTMHTIRARVDETGLHIPSTGVYRLRILDHDALLDQYLAFALTGSWNARFQVGSTIQRAPIRNLEVPLVPIHDQRNIALATAATRLFSEKAAELAAQAETIGNALLDAVRYNSSRHLP
jgi:SAM-dependent methyltransferase